MSPAPNVIDVARLQAICEDVLMDHIGPVSFIVAQDAVKAFQMMPNVNVSAQLAAFSVTLRAQIPSDLPRDAIARRVVELYLKP